MTKKEKEIYEFTKQSDLSPFGAEIFHYISGAFPKAKMENVINVVHQLQQDKIETNKQHLISLMGF